MQNDKMMNLGKENFSFLQVFFTRYCLLSEKVQVPMVFKLAWQTLFEETILHRIEASKNHACAAEIKCCRYKQSKERQQKLRRLALMSLRWTVSNRRWRVIQWCHSDPLWHTCGIVKWHYQPYLLWNRTARNHTNSYWLTAHGIFTTTKRTSIMQRLPGDVNKLPKGQTLFRTQTRACYTLQCFSTVSVSVDDQMTWNRNTPVMLFRNTDPKRGHCNDKHCADISFRSPTGGRHAGLPTR